MFAEVNHPDTLLPEELDAYLQRGWFRMGPTIFTTNFLSFKDNLYSAIWLRVLLDSYNGEKTQARLFRLNSIFSATISAATITPEKEALFALYKKGVAFEASTSLQHLLFGKSTRAAYNTLEITIRDEDKLIATGYFDLGSSAGMGITSFYDPAYKKHSLGMYLIYMKIEYCQKKGFRYFYPGYFVPGYSFFDYKLTIAKKSLQYLQLETQQWFAIQKFSKNLTPLQIMMDRLKELESELAVIDLSSKVMRYEFFDANLIPDLVGAGLFDYPLFLFLPGSIHEAINIFVVYNVVERQYHMVRCRGIWKTNSATSSEEIYSSFVLKIEETLYATPSAFDLVMVINAEKKEFALRSGGRA
ncbi:MAG: arginyl-tRNA--protein arginylyltransferase [Chryseolinea sp.]